MAEAFICDAVRVPAGRCGGALLSVRADDMAAVPLTGLMARNPAADWAAVDDLINDGGVGQGIAIIIERA